MNAKKYGHYLIQEGYRRRASDIYIFPTDDFYEIYFRYPNQRILSQRLPLIEGEQLLLYFKYLADMDVAEKRRMQVGAGDFVFGKKNHRLRFSTVANYRNQESLVIRLLHNIKQTDNDAYFLKQQLSEVHHLTQGAGLYLFCGPTGSGKTTTMYRLAQAQANAGRQVITVEDPVELVEDAFLQLQTNQKIGLTYEALIKLCLRHRPDILIVGEIRDKETAQAVIRGALTGHTIYSTVHGLAKESIQARLIELGVALSDIEQSLRGIIFQRLLPVQCPYCGEECHQYCHQRKEAILFDYQFFAKQEGRLLIREETNWAKSLQKVWLLGAISQKNYQAAKNS